MNRAYDDPATRDLHHHAYESQQAHRLRVALVSAAAAGDISREDRRVKFHVDDGVLALDMIAYLAIGFLVGGITAGLMLWWL